MEFCAQIDNDNKPLVKVLQQFQQLNVLLLNVLKVLLVPHSVPGMAMDNDAKVDVSFLYLSAAVHLEVDGREEVDDGVDMGEGAKELEEGVPQ